MKCYFSSMKTIKTWCLVVVATLGTQVSAVADAKAEKILEKARYASTLQVQDLAGHIRKDGKKVPIRLYLRKENIQFQFYDGKTWQKFHMRLKQGGGELFEIKGDKTLKFSAKKLSESVMNTDLTYQDLAMSFLYWKNSEVVGTETIKLQKCDQLRLKNPGGQGNYAMVYASIHQKYGALMRVIGTDTSNRVLKEFAIDKLMTVGKNKTVKIMKVQSFDAKSKKMTGATYLEFDKPKKDTTPL